MSRTDLARHLNVSKQRAHYNVNALRRLALLQSTGEGMVALSTTGVEAVSHIPRETSGATPASE